MTAQVGHPCRRLSCLPASCQRVTRSPEPSQPSTIFTPVSRLADWEDSVGLPAYARIRRSPGFQISCRFPLNGFLFLSSPRPLSLRKLHLCSQLSLSSRFIGITQAFRCTTPRFRFGLARGSLAPLRQPESGPRTMPSGLPRRFHPQCATTGHCGRRQASRTLCSHPASFQLVLCLQYPLVPPIPAFLPQP